MAAGVPSVVPTTPGLPEPPAQPEMPETRVMKKSAAVATAQPRRRRRVAKTNMANAASARSDCKRIRSGSKLRGSVSGATGPGGSMDFDGWVVVTVIPTVVGTSSEKELGDAEQVLAGMAPPQVTVTGPLNPPAGVRESWNVAGCPAATEAELELPGAGAMMMSVPLPDRVMDCGLAGPLSVMVMAPARALVAVGVKVMEIVHEELAGTPLVQVSVSAKSPLALMLVKVRVALPGLVRVTVCVALVEFSNWLPKGTALAERLTAGPEGVPVPLRTRDCGASPALS